MEKIIVYREIFEIQINDLIDILIFKEYFSFEESAVHYAEKIYHFIDANIDSPLVKTSPEKFQKYGKKYLRYKANNQTSWYIFFDHKNHRFLVNHILNNHSQDFPELL
ncbi:hypothetical protein [Kaistella polysaccharea]|uniref:hypothetical protein n=1 Tax=Kaistella polysaccharea TaxID=2878534 RepID=UPI001CF51FF4|nr:hypothetical protein [Kaistella polysaccharea]